MVDIFSLDDYTVYISSWHLELRTLGKPCPATPLVISYASLCTEKSDLMPYLGLVTVKLLYKLSLNIAAVSHSSSLPISAVRNRETLNTIMTLTLSSWKHKFIARRPCYWLISCCFLSLLLFHTTPPPHCLKKNKMDLIFRWKMKNVINSFSFFIKV